MGTFLPVPDLQPVKKADDLAGRNDSAAKAPAAEHPLLHLQRTMGNRAVRQLVSGHAARSSSSDALVQRKPAKDDLPPVPKIKPPAPPPQFGWTDEQLAKWLEDTKDPAAKKYEAEQKFDQALKALKEAENDATRHDRFMNLRGVALYATHYPFSVEEIADYLFAHYSAKDIQILRRFGLKGHLPVSYRNHGGQNLLDAVNAYDNDWRQKNGHSGPEASPISKEQIVAERERAEFMHQLQVLEMIEGGVGAAIGYGIGGEEGARLGALADDALQGFGGMAGGGGGAHESNVPEVDPVDFSEPVRPEPPAPTPDPIEAHKPTPAKDPGPPAIRPPAPSKFPENTSTGGTTANLPAKPQLLLPPGPDAPKQITGTQVPQIAMGDVKSISDRKALRHVSEMDGRERYNTDGNVGIAYYDRQTGEVILQVFGPPPGPGMARQVIYEQPIGVVPIPKGRTPIQIGGDVEEPVRQVVRQATNQNFPYKSPYAHGPDLTTPRR